MNVLLINTFHYNRGGDAIYNFNLASLLKRKKHKVLHFAMKHPMNFPSEYEKYFVPEIDFLEILKKRKFIDGLKNIKRGIWYDISQKNLINLLKENKVDIAHIQNIRGHITTSILPILKDHNIPIVWTLHDFFFLCPNSTFYSHNQICEKCRNRRFYYVLLNRCRKDSYIASLLVMIEEYFIHFSKVLDYVDVFICPSEFLYKKFLSGGFPHHKLKRIPNFIDITELSKTYTDTFLFAGRLSFEKGVKTLLKAFSLIKCKAKLEIVGDGPLRKECEDLAKKLSLKNVKFIGMLERKEVLNKIKKSFAIVIPSECNENFPYSIIEAFAFGKPVIGSNIGAIPEILGYEKRGLLFKYSDPEDLASKIDYLFSNPKLAITLGRNGYKYASTELNPETHYNRIIDLYNSLLKK